MDDLNALALNGFQEANLEPDDGLAAVCQVVLNRSRGEEDGRGRVSEIERLAKIGVSAAAKGRMPILTVSAVDGSRPSNEEAFRGHRNTLWQTGDWPAAVRAILTAMREPSEGMRRVAYEELHHYMDPKFSTVEEVATECFQAMIDHILNESE